MTKLLVSVRSAQEAELVRCHRIGILDVKEPDRGGLGASDRDTLKQIADVVNKSKREFDLSFSAGELTQWHPHWAGANFGTGLVPTRRSLPQYYGLELLSQYQFVKLGLAGVATSAPVLDWRSAWRELFADLPESIRTVAVSYLDFRDCDAPSPSMVLQLAADMKNCDVVLFDTFHKSGNLFSHVSINKLTELVKCAHRLGLTPVVAGSVSLSCLSDVVSSSPGFVGIRGAVCRGGRVGEISAQLVEEFVMELNQAVLIK